MSTNGRTVSFSSLYRMWRTELPASVSSESAKFFHYVFFISYEESIDGLGCGHAIFVAGLSLHRLVGAFRHACGSSMKLYSEKPLPITANS